MNEEIKGEKNDKITPGNTEGTPLSRTEILQKLSESIQLMHNRIMKGRSRNTKNDKLKQEWLRALGYISSVYLAGLKDLEIEQLTERIERLEKEKERLRE